MASAITQWVAANLYSRLRKPREPIGKALLFGVEGELHQLGVQFMADVLELEGWSVIFLGTNTPTAAALATIDQHHPDVVGLAATMLFSLPATLDAVAEIRGRHPELPVVVGGRAFTDAADACREAGVIGVADSLESGRTLLAGVAAVRAV
jgi:methanogenic corrinoid protein MtbC1